MDQPLKERLDTIADEKGLSTSALVRMGMLELLKRKLIIYFLMCLTVVTDATAQLGLTGEVDPVRLAWTALAAASAALLLHGVIAGNLTSVLAGAAVALAVLARIGVVVLPPVVGVVALAFLIGLAMCPQKRVRPPARSWLVSVATGGGGILAIFVVLDWLSALG